MTNLFLSPCSHGSTRKTSIGSGSILELHQGSPSGHPAGQSTTECILDAAEAAVGYDVIYILTHCPAFLLLSGILPRWAVPLSIR